MYGQIRFALATKVADGMVTEWTCETEAAIDGVRCVLPKGITWKNAFGNKTLFVTRAKVINGVRVEKGSVIDYTRFPTVSAAIEATKGELEAMRREMEVQQSDPREANQMRIQRVRERKGACDARMGNQTQTTKNKK